MSRQRGFPLSISATPIVYKFMTYYNDVTTMVVGFKWNRMASKPWRKILYEKQNFPDNYVDKTQFLNGLKKNCKRCTGYCVHSAQCAKDRSVLQYTHRLMDCKK